MLSLANQVSGSQFETETDVHEITIDETPQNQTATGPPQNNQSPEKQAASTNATSDQFSPNQTATQSPVNEAVRNTASNQPPTYENATQTSESQVDQASSNMTAIELQINQTTTKPSQTNQHPVNLPSKNTTVNPLQSDHLQFDNVLQTSQSATKGIIKYSSAS